MRKLAFVTVCGALGLSAVLFNPAVMATERGPAPSVPAIELASPSSRLVDAGTFEEAQKVVPFAVHHPAAVPDGFRVTSVQVLPASGPRLHPVVMAGFKNDRTNAHFSVHQSSLVMQPGNPSVTIPFGGGTAQLVEFKQASGHIVRGLFWSVGGTYLEMVSMDLGAQDFLSVAEQYAKTK